jgi:hypothetical protein
MRRAFIFLCAVFLFGGCFLRSGDREIVFDNSDPLALAPDVTWAVVEEPYVAFHKTAGWDATVTGQCRRGEIYRIIGVRTLPSGDTAEKWYCLSQGWLPGTAIAVCQNKLSAQSLSETFK